MKLLIYRKKTVFGVFQNGKSVRKIKGHFQSEIAVTVFDRLTLGSHYSFQNRSPRSQF